MAGRVLGRYFKQVVTSLLHAGVGSSELEAYVDGLDEAGEYPWAQFVEALQQASKTVRRADLIAIGRRLMTSSKPEFERWGFDSAEAILTDFDAPFGAAIIDPPEHERIITAKYEPGYAVFRAADSYPAGLVEGYLRGVVEMYGGRIDSVACHQVFMNGYPFHLIEMRWWTPARPVRVRRAPSGPHVRQVA